MHRSEVLAWLSDIDFQSNFHDALQLRETGTGQWIVTHERFNSWKDGQVQTLWLHGMRMFISLFRRATALSNIVGRILLTILAGAGKTFLS
jgi:hypothetical protein